MPALGIKSAVGLAATVAGTCSGHGVCIPAHIHFALPPCELPFTTPSPVPVYPVATKDATCLWPPFNTMLMTATPRNVLINGQIPLLDQDILTLHPASCSNTVTRLCTSGDSCSRLDTKMLPCGELTTEDKKNGGSGHERKVIASAKTVLVNGKPLAVVGDALGPPCLSLISTGSINVMAGTGGG
jgi:uncharacterized Zn-binding protein involved in type VI secretion